MNYHFIAIEGNIGVGKTTLAQKLAGHYRTRLILEQFADNPFLPEFYKDKERYAFPLELSFLADRYEQLKDTLLNPTLNEELIIADYTITKSLLFARNNLNNDEYDLFMKMAAIMNTTLPKPDLLIYLHAPIDKLQRQIQQRGRPYELNIEDTYLEEISLAYGQYLDREDLKVLMIDTAAIDLNRADYFELLIRFLESDSGPGTHTLSN
jgi:deoxyadenosine/deoxycytidine kinase